MINILNVYSIARYDRYPKNMKIFILLQGMTNILGLGKYDSYPENIEVYTLLQGPENT